MAIFSSRTIIISSRTCCCTAIARYQASWRRGYFWFKPGWDSNRQPVPLWISHLPGLFSDAQIDLLITNFLLLFVTCCVVRGGDCKIISVSSNEGPVRNCVSMMWLSNTLSNTLPLPELLIQTSGLDQDLLGIREINCWVSVNYETKTITVLLSTGAKENNKNNGTSQSW